MKKAEPATTISIRFPNSLLQAVRNIADVQDRSVTYLTVQAVKAWLAPVPTPRPVAAQPAPPSVAAVQPEPAPMSAQAAGEAVATTAKRAKEMGLTRYYTGLSCAKGHVAERYLNGSCVECMRISNAAKNKAKAAV